MENKPLISIIMPVYNAEKYVRSAIQSVIEQTFQNWELIIIDDKSSDNSGEICDKWGRNDKRVRVIHLSKNGGAGNARNTGIREAQGKYITFLDSDDSINRELYETVLRKSKGYDIDLFVWGVTEQYYDRKGRIIRENKLFLPTKLYLDENEVHDKVIELEDKTLFGYQWNHLYKSEIVKKNSIYFEPVVLYEDYFFNLAYISCISSMCIVDNVGYYYAKRMNQSITNQYVQDYFPLSQRRVNEMLKMHERWGKLSMKVTESCGNRYLRYICSAIMRNNDKRSEMSRKEKKEWIKRLYKEPLYMEVAKNCKPNGMLLVLLQKLVNIKCTMGCLLLGKMLYIIKYRFPQFFSKKSIIK